MIPVGPSSKADSVSKLRLVKARGRSGQEATVFSAMLMMMMMMMKELGNSLERKLKA